MAQQRKQLAEEHNKFMTNLIDTAIEDELSKYKKKKEEENKKQNKNEQNAVEIQFKCEINRN